MSVFHTLSAGNIGQSGAPGSGDPADAGSTATTWFRPPHVTTATKMAASNGLDRLPMVNTEIDGTPWGPPGGRIDRPVDPAVAGLGHRPMVLHAIGAISRSGARARGQTSRRAPLASGSPASRNCVFLTRRACSVSY